MLSKIWKSGKKLCGSLLPKKRKKVYVTEERLQKILQSAGIQLSDSSYKMLSANNPHISKYVNLRRELNIVKNKLKAMENYLNIYAVTENQNFVKYSQKKRIIKGNNRNKNSKEQN